MNLTISGHHLDVSPALREYVLTKMDKITRHFDQVVDINVLLSVEKLSEKERRQKAEVTLHVKGKDIFVEHASEDLYARSSKPSTSSTARSAATRTGFRTTTTSLRNGSTRRSDV